MGLHSSERRISSDEPFACRSGGEWRHPTSRMGKACRDDKELSWQYVSRRHCVQLCCLLCSFLHVMTAQEYLMICLQRVDTLEFEQTELSSETHTMTNINKDTTFALMNSVSACCSRKRIRSLVSLRQLRFILQHNAWTQRAQSKLGQSFNARAVQPAVLPMLQSSRRLAHLQNTFFFFP